MKPLPPPIQTDLIDELPGSKPGTVWGQWFLDFANYVGNTLDFTGTGAYVRQVSPTLVTPILGVADGTSLDLSGDLEALNIVTGNPAALIKTSTTLTDGAGAALGTLTNAPSVGNPSKWVAIDDNGTTRYIPTWV